MKKEKRLLLFFPSIFLLAFVPEIVNAQDFTFSQATQIRQITNPARIGGFNEDIRVSGAFRNQWYASGAPYEVVNLNAELNFFKNPLSLDKIGTMLGVVQDKMGNGALKTTYISTGISAYKSLDAVRRHRVSFGLQGSVQLRELNPSSFTFNNQFDPIQRTFDGNLSSNEVFGSKNQTFFQVSIGGAYYFQATENLQLQLNGSFIGLNSIQESFSTLPDLGNSTQKKRFTIGFEIENRFSERISIQPLVYFNRQGPSQELVFGSWLGFKPGRFSISPGVFYRLNDAIIPAIKMDYTNWTASFSYDATLSDVTGVNNKEKLIGLGGFGAMEFTLAYKGIFRKKTGTKLSIPCRTF